MNNNTELSPAMSIISERCDAVSIIVPLSNSKAGNFVMETKRCSKCEEVRLLNEFRFLARSKDGYDYICKICKKKKSKENRKTKSYIVINTYYSLCAKSLRRNHKSPQFSVSELREWMLSQEIFHELYDKWVISGYDKWERPSIDRVNDYIGYSFSNMQILTWSENHKKAISDMKNGVNTKSSKAIIQYDLDGNFIKEHYSVRSAGREMIILSTNICQALKGNIKHSGGFIWKYKNIKNAGN